jgi:uncharacterized membrane protein YdjX (TVP38/TMEM64 family)
VQNHLRVHGWKWFLAAIFIAILISASLKYINKTTVTDFVEWVQGLGIFGVIFCILFMALLCFLPVPSEIVIIVYMQLFGVFRGTLYAWLGAIMGAVIALLFVRLLGRPLVEKHIPRDKLQKVDQLVHKRGTIGMLILRFTPFIPFHALNYAFGLVPIRLWPFIWTTAIGIAPFDIMLAGGFVGIKEGNLSWVFLGTALFAGLIGFGFYLRKKISQP